jgi:AcrR family transcriptional regulator
MVAGAEFRPADARERLLRAAMEGFGQHGFAAASTRGIAAAAGVNLQAINYYFGGKRGLYLAVADHIAERIEAHTAALSSVARARFASGAKSVTPEEAQQLLAEMLGRVAAILFDDQWTPIARFMVREQMDPSDAFERIYGRVMEPYLEMARRIVGAVTGDDPRSTRTRLRTLSLAGSIIFFRIAHATAQRQLGWTTVGPRELASLRELIRETVAAVAAGGKARKAAKGKKGSRRST